MSFQQCVSSPLSQPNHGVCLLQDLRQIGYSKAHSFRVKGLTAIMMSSWHWHTFPKLELFWSIKLFSHRGNGSYTSWRHQMEAFSALLALCVRKSPVTGEFPSQRVRNTDFDVPLMKACISCETNSGRPVIWDCMTSMWRHRNAFLALWEGNRPITLTLNQYCRTLLIYLLLVWTKYWINDRVAVSLWHRDTHATSI